MELFSFLSNVHHSLWSTPFYVWPFVAILYLYLTVWSILLVLLGTPLPFFAISKGIKLKQSPWKLFKTPFSALMIMMVQITAPITIIPFIPFIKKDKEPTPDYDGNPLFSTIRGDIVPEWANKIFATPDARFPGGIYEPTVKRWLEKYGFYVCSYLWAGTRNMMFGLTFMFGEERKPVFEEGKEYTELERNAVIYGPPVMEIDGYWENGNSWKYVAKFSFGIWVVGHQVYKKPDGKHWTVPTVTVKKLNNI